MIYAILVLGCLCNILKQAVGDPYPSNAYEYAQYRESLVDEETAWQVKRPSLNQDEQIVDRYLGFVKWQEFQRTKKFFLPARPLHEALPNITSSELYRLLKPLPKGGNMHSHENHLLSKRTLLDIVFDSEDFQHLYILPENHTSNPWKLDFFINPPPGEGWINVKANQDKYSKEIIYPTQVFFGIMDDYTKKYPSDSTERWRQMNKLWGRGSGQLINNRKIKQKYVWDLLEQGYENGILYQETRKSFQSTDGIYELDPSPEYNATFGKKNLDTDNELDINMTLEVINNFTSQYPDFIGMKRIIYTTRTRPQSFLQADVDRVKRMSTKYPNHVMAYDLVGEEDAGNSLLYFHDFFANLHDPETQNSKVPLIFHSVETSWPDDLMTSINNEDIAATLQNIYDAIILGTQRVGHGLGVIKKPFLIQKLKEKNIAIESCPLSNQILGLIPDVRNHPAMHYHLTGIPVVLGSDDPGTFGYDNITVDWYAVYLSWGLGLADLKLLAINSLNYSSMSTTEKQDAINVKWQRSWDNYIQMVKSEACSQVLNSTDPTFKQIFPDSGAINGGNKVHVFGHNFEQAICSGVQCKFGTMLSPVATYMSNEHVVCTAPNVRVAGGRAGDEVHAGDIRETGPLEIFLSLDGGATFVSTGRNYTYVYDAITSTQIPATNHPVGMANNNFLSSPLVVICGLFVLVNLI